MAMDVWVVKALNRVCARQPWIAERLRRFGGSQAELVFGRQRLAFAILPDGGFGAPQSNRSADVQISLPERALSFLLTDRHALFSSARISGSADLAEALGFVFKNLEWDIEGELADVIGDIPARRTLQLGRAGIAQVSRSITRIGENFAEYLSEESGLVVERGELRGFVENLEALGSELTQLEARIRKL